MATSTKSRLTGERPQQGVTPDSLLALHEAGLSGRPGPHRNGAHPRRRLRAGLRVGEVPRRPAATSSASTTRPTPWRRPPPATAPTASGWPRWTRSHWACGPASFDAACSSHLIEHFTEPEAHVAELARVLKDDGLACVLTPNKPADFENPFHRHLFERTELRAMLGRHFGDVWLRRGRCRRPT